MKQALIADDGLTVANVRNMPVDEDGAAIMPEGDPYAGPVLMLADDAYCGVGMVWDGATDAPLFTYPADLSAETASVWAKVKAFFGVGA